jgi:hypothetical protein
MIGDALVSGHILLADWAFLIAAVVFLALAVLAVLRSRPSPPTGSVAGSSGLWHALPYVASALVALGLLVL